MIDKNKNFENGRDKLHPLVVDEGPRLSEDELYELQKMRRGHESHGGMVTTQVTGLQAFHQVPHLLPSSRHSKTHLYTQPPFRGHHHNHP